MIDPSWLGLQHARDYARNVQLVVGLDGVVWYQRSSWEWFVDDTPGTEVYLHNGILTGYTTFKSIDQWIRFAERPPLPTVSSLTQYPILTPSIKTIDLERRIKANGKDYYIAAQGVTREELSKYADDRTLIMLPEPPAVRTNQTMYGEAVWFDLTCQELYVHMRRDGYRVCVDREIEGVMAHGQHRQANQKVHGNPYKITSVTPGTTSQAAAQQTADLAAYQAASQGINQLGGGLGSFPNLTPQQIQQLQQQIYIPPPLPREDPKLGEITAWRGWAIDVNNCALASISQKHIVWQPAKEVVSELPTEGQHDHNGIHAFKTCDTAVSYLTSAYSGALIALGRVALWGEVVEGETGYRAERARILDIDCLLNMKNMDAIYGNLPRNKWDEFYLYWKRLRGNEPKLLKQLQDKYNKPLEGGNMNIDSDCYRRGDDGSVE